ncbi:MAG TPA: hypothetical protein VGX91_10295 [Candidatus Cybelea sp.]|jgi:photosystem II stability/assembly factor-like uncharacterized protein|nr:hypothetical protein [Candidatus Cybelea sp.]
MRWRVVLLAAGALSLAAPLVARADERPVAQMRWRAIGPALPEGRASAVVGSNLNPLLYYAGTADGGVWKSVDGGTSWQNVSDLIHLGSVGAIAVAANDGSDVWVGAGETNPRNDVIPESGLYHSTNGGRSWQVVAFPSAPGISRIVLDPSDPKHIVIGVLGDVFAPSSQRGVYVSFDGGATFSKTLYLSEQSGASDIAMDPKNPSVVYAGMWHVLRRPWAIVSGGTNDDGLYRSGDGGRTWKEVTGNGFPAAPIGRIGVAIAPSQPNRIYALVESAAGVLWRSDDSGVTWKLVSSDSLANQRPFYFSHVRVSPTDSGTVYAPSMLLATSYNAGEKFNLSAFGVHSDLHDMWISSDGNRMALAGDGGIAISANGGATWSNSRNIAIAQVYRVGLSSTVPYLVCGGLQDNNAYCGPAFSGNLDGITNRDWFKVTEGDGEWAVPDPTNSRLIWADSQNGELVVYDRVSHESTNVRPYRGTAQEDFVLASSRYRFNWESPIAFAAYDPRVAFIGANVLFETSDGGKHWKAISPDLTRNDKSKQQVAKNSVTQDESGAENYGTILDIETSAQRKGEIWTGSDDGLVYVTRDGGAHWRNVTPSGLPADSAVETVAPSPRSPGTVFVSADRHAMGDDNAYIFVTHDDGARWQRVTNGIPSGEYVRAVRPDIANANIVYAGTNRGVRISCDGGANWQTFQNNLPAVEVRDIRIEPRFDDLVIATHGRAIWVMDDIRPVQQSACAVPTAPLVIGPRPGIDLIGYRDDEGNYTDFDAQQPGGGLLSNGGAVASLYYWLPEMAKKRPTIDVYDLQGHLWRHIEGKHDIFTGEEGESYWLSRTDGKNAFDYDFTIDGPTRYESAPFFFRGPEEGPALPPGRYIMAFHLDGKTYRFPLLKIADPLSTTTPAEYRAQFEEQRRVYDLLGRVDAMLNALHSVRETLVADKKALKSGDAASGAKLQSAIDGIDAIVATITSSPQSFEDFIAKPGQLREDVLGLMNDESLAQATLRLYARLERNYADRAKAYNAWVASLTAVNATLKAAGEQPVTAANAP